MAKQFKKNEILQILTKDADASITDIAKKVGCATSYVCTVRGEWAKQQEPQEEPEPQLSNMRFQSEDLSERLQLLNIHPDDRDILMRFVVMQEKRIEFQLGRLNEAYRLIGSNLVDECMEY
jgi:DNA-binding Lrp family transcriptional regulator